MLTFSHCCKKELFVDCSKYRINSKESSLPYKQRTNLLFSELNPFKGINKGHFGL